MRLNKNFFIGFLLIASVTATAKSPNMIKFVNRVGDGSGAFHVVAPLGEDRKIEKAVATIDCDKPAKIKIKGRESEEVVIDQEKCLALVIELSDKISTHEVLVSLEADKLTFEAYAKNMTQDSHGWSHPLNTSTQLSRPSAKGYPNRKLER